MHSSPRPLLSLLCCLCAAGCPDTEGGSLDDDDAADDDDTSVGDDDDTSVGDDDDDTSVGDDDDDTSVGDDDDTVIDPTLDVLYLGDDGQNNGVIYDHLAAAGFNVTDGSPFFNWDGVQPDVTNFDVVVYVEGFDYGRGLTPPADAALTAWMLAGGGVIRSEWIAYELGDTVTSETDFDQYLPVESPSSDFLYDAVWTVTDSGHPLTAGLPASWTSEEGGCTVASAFAETVVVATAEGCGPALSYMTHGTNGGKVIHINDDFGEDQGSAPDPDALQVLTNAVLFVGE